MNDPLRVAVVGSGPAGFYAAGALLASDDPSRRGRPDRPASDAVGARAARRRPRPSEHQGGLARVREDRRPRAVPVLRERRGRARRHAGGARRALRRGRPCVRRADRPAARDPGRGPPRLVARDRVRRLVQRPPRLPGPLVRPLARAGRRDRQRERRPRRRADAGADPGGARADGHDRRRDRRDQRGRDPRDRRRRPARPGAGGVDARRGRRAGRARRGGHARRAGRPRAGPGERRGARGGAPDGAPQRRAPPRVRGARARRPPARDPAPLPARRPSRSRRRSRRGDRARPQRARRRARGADGRAETIECGVVFRSVGYHGVALPGVPFDASTAPSRMPVAACSAGRSPGPGLYCAGWIKRGPSGVIGTNKKDATETVELLLEDARAGGCPRVGEDLEGSSPSAASRTSLYAGWEAIDAHERGLGEPLGRPRVKLATWDELLSAARPARATDRRDAEAVARLGAVSTTGERRELWAGRRPRRSPTSRSPASRSRSRSRTGWGGSRPPPRASTPTSACSTPTSRSASPPRATGSPPASSTTSSRSTSSRPAPARART